MIDERRRFTKVTDQDINRFWSYVTVKKKDDCWLWRGSKIPKGYGVFSIWKFGKSNGKRVSCSVLAHIFSYWVKSNKDPEGYQVCHSCDNRLCVNPNHLWLGDNTSNQKDAALKGRTTRGANHPHAKLTEKQVDKVFDLHEEGWTNTAIAKKFKVSQPSICVILKGRSWKYHPRQTK